MICYTCGKKKGNKEPGKGATWHCGKCSECLQQNYLTEKRDFGIVEGPLKEDNEIYNFLKGIMKKP